REGVEFAHKKGVKVYIALNIFPHNEDVDKIIGAAKTAHSLGVDAAIISDLGTIIAVREQVPGLDIHVSTQANIVNSRTAAAFYRLGATRVVLARELSLTEIKEIREKTPVGLELEMFVHGAMCISYSGRCLLSNYMTGRDSNQGACAQPCRWNYSLMEEKRPGEYYPVFEDERGSYIFNSKDLCLIDHIPEIIEAGVTSFKIEGRVKTEYYVASVVKVYREAIDAYYRDGEHYEFDPSWQSELKKVSHRNYCSGFFDHKTDENSQVYETSSYVRDYDIVGIVKEYNSETGIAVIEQRNRFFRGDEIEIIQPMVPGFFAQTVEEMTDDAGRDINVAPNAKMIVKIKLDHKVIPNSIVRKVRE
ncbi:MAG: U32 family peptidase C-terminal domain-containing protein, partial [Bacillota bacterium]|nr:U32 family peptidase C-terminal domain-containing protein [Bacillota bacterium]